MKANEVTERGNPNKYPYIHAQWYDHTHAHARPLVAKSCARLTSWFRWRLTSHQQCLRRNCPHPVVSPQSTSSLTLRAVPPTWEGVRHNSGTTQNYDTRTPFLSRSARANNRPRSLTRSKAPPRCPTNAHVLGLTDTWHSQSLGARLL